MCKIERNGQIKEFSKYSDKKIENIGEKYKSIFDREDKTKILDKIKTDISVKYKDISLLELEILSNNIYEYCCLTKNNISQDEILKYLLDRNNFYNSTFNAINELKGEIDTLKAEIETLKSGE